VQRRVHEQRAAEETRALEQQVERDERTVAFASDPDPRAIDADLAQERADTLGHGRAERLGSRKEIARVGRPGRACVDQCAAHVRRSRREQHSAQLTSDGAPRAEHDLVGRRAVSVQHHEQRCLAQTFRPDDERALRVSARRLPLIEECLDA